MKRILLVWMGLWVISLHAAQTDTIRIPDAVMGRHLRAVIVIPDAYSQTDRRFPVVYLLHGWSGSYRDWAAHMDLGPLADEYGFILVCPEGGYAGWYLDSPLKPKSRYETYLTKTVILFIDNHYRTIASRKGRFITGLSMGGHGALSLLCKHPELYDAAGSMSGVLELTASTRKYGLAQLLGDYREHRERWEKNSVLKLVEHLRGKPRGVLIDCGVADPFLPANRKVHRKMIELGIPHDYCERPGGHSWDYWTRVLKYHLMFFREWFLSHSR